MNPMYGGNAAAYGPPRKVNFGWIGESWQFFTQAVGLWIVAALIMGLVPLLVGGLIGYFVGTSASMTPSASPSFSTASSPFGAFRPLAMGGGLPLGANIGIRIFSLVWTAFFYGGIYRMAVKQV